MLAKIKSIFIQNQLLSITACISILFIVFSGADSNVKLGSFSVIASVLSGLFIHQSNKNKELIHKIALNKHDSYEDFFELLEKFILLDSSRQSEFINSQENRQKLVRFKLNLIKWASPAAINAMIVFEGKDKANKDSPCLYSILHAIRIDMGSGDIDKELIKKLIIRE